MGVLGCGTPFLSVGMTSPIADAVWRDERPGRNWGGGTTAGVSIVDPGWSGWACTATAWIEVGCGFPATRSIPSKPTKRPAAIRIRRREGV